MKRILLDQGLAPSAALLLRAEGWDAVHVREIGLATADDAHILDVARQEARICITLDHDFHANLAFNRAEQPSVVLLRVQKLDAAGQTDLIRAIWQICEKELTEGVAASADSSSIRIRRLPLK